MKTAVIYYSLSGGCALIAEELKAGLGADLIRLHTENEKPRRGFSSFFWGMGVMLGMKKAPLKAYTFDPSSYDLIIIGAPVWGGLPALPVREFLANANITGKKIALFMCHGGGMIKTLDKLIALLPDNEIVSVTDFISPIKNSEKVKQQAADWVKNLQVIGN